MQTYRYDPNPSNYLTGTDHWRRLAVTVCEKRLLALCGIFVKAKKEILFLFGVFTDYKPDSNECKANKWGKYGESIAALVKCVATSTQFASLTHSRHSSDLPLTRHVSNVGITPLYQLDATGERR